MTGVEYSRAGLRTSIAEKHPGGWRKSCYILNGPQAELNSYRATRWREHWISLTRCQSREAR